MNAVCSCRTHLLNGELKRCGQYAEKGSEYCYYHGKMAADQLGPHEVNDTLGEFDKDNGVHYVADRRGALLWVRPEPLEIEEDDEEVQPVAA